MELIIEILILGTGINIFLWFTENSATVINWREAIRNAIISEIAILAVSIGVYFITKGCK